MEQKLISEPTQKSNNFRDDSLKSYSISKFSPEINIKKESKFKTINNISKEIIISSKKKDIDNLNRIKPKLLKGNLPQVFNVIEKRHSSCDQKNYSEKIFNNSNSNINEKRKDISPILKIKDYASNTEQKGFKNYNPKVNNYFREKALSPSPIQLNQGKDNSNILISEINTKENIEELNSKIKTNFSDYENKTLIRNKTIATNFSSVGFNNFNENNNITYNDSFVKFNAWNGVNTNMANINKNKMANAYLKQFFPFGKEIKTNNNNDKKYDNIYIENNIKPNKSKQNGLINKININTIERGMVKRSPSETHEKNNYIIENMKEEILKYNFNRNKRINTNENEQKDNNKYFSHEHKKLRIFIDKINNQINLNEGISFKILNDYKYYFNIINVNIYLLKEIQNHYVNKLKEQIKLWNNKYNNELNDTIFIRIYDIKINVPENHSTIIMEHPIGGENLTSLVNSVGFRDEKILLKIISKLYNNILIFQNNNYFNNIPFCLCDIFVDVYDQIKIIPPLIRKISYLDNQYNENEKCLCKDYFYKIKKIFEINNNYISIFCLGLTIIQLITQNLIFKMKSFDIFINDKKNNKELKKCCLVHTLLTIEILFADKKRDLLLSNFLELYPKTLIQFLHECTDFKGKNSYQSYERLIKIKDNYNTKIAIKELLKIIELPKNNYCKLSEFLMNFEILYKNFNINSDSFKNSLKRKKIISLLSRTFNIKKEKFLEYFLRIIDNGKK